MAINITVAVDDDILQAYQQRIPQYPKLLQRAFQGELRRVSQKYLKQLQTPPGAPRYPLRWKSERQRRYVMAKLRRENNLPYQRTGRLTRGWKLTLERDRVRLENATPYAIFVQGDWAQPFHLDTGWPQAAPLISAMADELTDALIQTWYSITTWEPT